jgi:RNA-binding protein
MVLTPCSFGLFELPRSGSMGVGVERFIDIGFERSLQMTTKQRAYLKGLAMTMDPIYQIGKSALTPEITEGVSEALEARELIKINVLKNCVEDPNEIARTLSERTHSEIVQVIGKKIVLYRESKEKKKIVLPVDKKSKNKG